MKKLTSRLALMATVASVFIANTPLFASETDDRIESSAKQTYVFKTYLNNDDIKIQSKDGFVTLTGTVSGEAHKLLAQETVGSLPGVKGVENKLMENGEVPAVYTDAWLVSKVRSTLFFHRNLSLTGTEVLSEKSVITLRGVATSTAQKDLATEYAKDVEGVKDVKNEMTVSTAPPAADAKAKTTGEKVDSVVDLIDDTSITALVKATLLSHRSTSALHTSVETKDGMVKLGGKAKNAAEKDLATKVVVDVHGVKSVYNEMTIE